MRAYLGLGLASTAVAAVIGFFLFEEEAPREPAPVMRAVGAPMRTFAAAPAIAPRDSATGSEAASEAGIIPADASASTSSGDDPSGDETSAAAASRFGEVDPESGVLYLDFESLAAFQIPEGAEVPEGEEPAAPEIPASIRGLDRQRVDVEGFMMPLDLDGLEIYRFYLAPNHLACCYGASPRINELIEVDVPDGARYYPDVPIRVVGRFEVGVRRDTFGQIESIYRVSAEVVEEVAAF